MSSDGQATRDPLAELPDDGRQQVLEHLNGEPVIAAIRADLTLEGHFSEQWLVVSPHRLLLWRGEGVQQLPLDELDELRVEAYVGNAYLYARANGQQIPLLRFTHSRRMDFERLAQAFRRYKSGELSELRLEEAEPTVRRPGFLSGRQGRCPKCQQPLPPWTDVCPFCLQKTKVLKRMLTFVKPYWFAAAGGFLLLVLIQLADLAQPLLMRFTVDEALLKKNLHHLVVVVAAVLGLNFAGAVLSGVRSYLMAWLGERIVMDIRRRLYEHLHLLSLRFFDQEQTGRLVSRVTNDTGQLQDFLTEGLQDILRDLFMLLFVELRYKVAQRSHELLETAKAVAELDVLATLAEVAAKNHYTRPFVDDGDEIVIKEGRHPVIEQVQRDKPFVPNDCSLDNRENQLLIITGPNAAGKSTYLRQVALIVLVAQMGSFVPAREAKIGIVDRIFTRVGAHDELVRGQSTFMVEMTETANILHNATERSLVLIDEIGRGTSTYDGIAIAWAVAEELHRIGCKCLFATHYHHLNELENLLPRVRNYRAAVLEEGDKVVFLYRIVPGGTDRSYGIQVARLAGLPERVIGRAKEILMTLESNDQKVVAPPQSAAQLITTPVQLRLFDFAPHPVLERLKCLDPDSLTPREALALLYELKRQAENQS